MTLIQKLRALLLRPVITPPAPIAAHAKVSRGGRVPVAQAELAPLTEAELVAAIQSAFEERQRIEELTTTADARRRELLVGDDDDALLAHDRARDLAEIQLERLDQIEPQLHSRLREVRRLARVERFAETRERLIAAAETTIPALRAAADAMDSWRAVRDAALAEFPNSEHHVPGVVLITHTDIDRFESHIGSFRHVAMHGAPQALHRNVSDVIAEAIRTGERPPVPSPFSEVVEKALQADHLVTVTRTWRDGNGQAYSPGTTLSLGFDEAESLVQRGYAIWKESKK